MLAAQAAAERPLLAGATRSLRARARARLRSPCSPSGWPALTSPMLAMNMLHNMTSAHFSISCAWSEMHGMARHAACGMRSYAAHRSPNGYLQHRRHAQAASERKEDSQTRKIKDSVVNSQKIEV